MARFARSSARLALPSFDTAELLACLKALLRVERGWIPSAPGFSLYLRPTHAATTPFLGVGLTSETVLYCVLSPCGPYLKAGAPAVKLFLEEEVVRAAPGGVGSFKVGGNYSPTSAWRGRAPFQVGSGGNVWEVMGCSSMRKGHRPPLSPPSCFSPMFFASPPFLSLSQARR